MHIAYVCCDPGVPVFGCKGCSIHVQEVLREFLRHGHHVDLFAASLGGTCPADLAQVNVQHLEIPEVKDRLHREQALFGLNRNVLRILTQNGPYQLVYERHSLFAYAAMEFARKRLIPGILEVNAPLVEEQSKYRELIYRELAERTARRVMTAAGAVVAVSDAVARYVSAQRLDPREIHVIPNGVNLARFPLDRSQNVQLRCGEFTIGFVGTLKPWHGLAQLLKAFPDVLKQVPSAKLLIVGDGPERERLQVQAQELLGETSGQVVFLGAVHATEIPELLRSMAVAVAPYLDQENFYFSPLKIFEYMAAALPIVAGNVGQISEVLEHGRSGLLVTPGSSQELSEALVKVANNPHLSQQLGERARKIAEERYSWKSVVTFILHIAAKVAAKLSHHPHSHPTHSLTESV